MRQWTGNGLVIKHSDFENIESTLHIPNAKFHHFTYFFSRHQLQRTLWKTLPMNAAAPWWGNMTYCISIYEKSALFCCVTTTVFLTALLSTISHFSVLQAADARDSSKPAGLAKTAEKHGSSKVRNLNKTLLTATVQTCKIFVGLTASVFFSFLSKLGSLFLKNPLLFFNNGKWCFSKVLTNVSLCPTWNPRRPFWIWDPFFVQDSHFLYSKLKTQNNSCEILYPLLNT